MKRHIYIWLVILACSCKVPYQPPVTTTAFNYLVVDGVINSSTAAGDSTLIKLSRTFKISTSPVTNPELHAQVSVEDAANNSYALQDAGKGNYVAGPLGLDGSKQYRLRIKTSDNRMYLSDLVAVKPTPPIDSIGFTASPNQLIIYANTHDATNNTRYYRWDYTETWEFHPPYSPYWISNGTKIVPITPAQALQMHTCWRGAISTDIILASSKQLTQDVIYQTPIAYIPSTSQKLSVEYSIQLKQYAVTEDDYTFVQQTKKNTEQLGSIFDALPSQINGNIHCVTNPAEPVFGYVSITNIQVKRVFIFRNQLPASYTYIDNACTTPDTAIYQAFKSFYVATYRALNDYPVVENDLIPLSSSAGPVDSITLPPPFKLRTGPPFFIPGPYPGAAGYFTEPKTCIDCRLFGTSVKPPYWK